MKGGKEREKQRVLWECFLSAVQSRAVTLCFLGIGGILVAGILAVAGTDGALMGILAVTFLTIVLLWLLVSGLLEWKRFAELERLLEGVSERYLLGEMLPKPVNHMERRYFRIMKEVSRSAIGIAEQTRREKEEYCDYVESWIHEMKTPLTACTLILDGAISGGSMLSGDREREKPTDTGFPGDPSGEKPDAGERMCERGSELRRPRRELKRADNLTESILYYARLRTAEKDVKIRAFSAAESIGEAVRSQMELLIGAGISVETEGDFTVYSDEKSLCFILKQLLVNCAKYCPGCHIRIRAEEGVISVWDNGPGIPAHELHRVTERGFTGSVGRAAPLWRSEGKEDIAADAGNPGRGTGMGLYIVKELCDRLGITMEITSEEGAFTCVALGYDSRA
ncbi:HAMP domain-containing histidine kinase [Acetatifactor muris]|uniref:histidine kinase n=1 Tax=Acetatifactor muris TaxID=879566 RepID=A0A2K4ZD02_9FIRM|nr:HAMP domain-containing sensor histidine kinase [Acetatifactor muris]MCR2046742.1 HAMP domain-containing histidine kinase [Acetatifactor muris]SOY28334.1 Sensor histidine kinase GraS [Acetatifactor muris]